ncbi:MAG: hypothetical protein HN704_01800 [Bacteroidetes bacterium]|jgi:uncharacterized protein|nr:hypothetical protein [Bacteroidota bacterium]MBT6686794.1 hypothetical protein [Bacteroidota bacterium]MBT7142369.1 hypothetical protein [Bacteroidota bacterium]MBT7490320.1 hypothetical protein [Bacteroidota bacterium]
MNLCFFVSDIHGSKSRYESLFKQIELEKPKAVFIGGDILPSAFHNFSYSESFIDNYLKQRFISLKKSLKSEYPSVFIILGNDDPAIFEQQFFNVDSLRIWHYIHNKKISFGDYSIFGYSYVPPTPFLIKDWEKYDIEHKVKTDCIMPENGKFSVSVKIDYKTSTIETDLLQLTENEDLSKSVFLFHSPPNYTKLDRIHSPDFLYKQNPENFHVGSLAISNLICEKKPYLTLHGHIHESSRRTGSWKHQYDRTLALSAAYHKPELALVKFDLNDLNYCERILL